MKHFLLTLLTLLFGSTILNAAEVVDQNYSGVEGDRLVGEAQPDGLVKIVPMTTAKIEGFKLANDTLKVEVEPNGEETKFVVYVVGTLAAQDWGLLRNNKVVALDKQRNFRIKVELSGPTTVLKLVAIGPLGEMERVEYGLLTEKFKSIKSEAKSAPPKRALVSLGLSLSYLAYEEVVFKSPKKNIDLTEWATTAKANAIYLILPPYIDVGASIYGTAFALTSSDKGAIRFFGVNGRVGLVLPWFQDPWRIGVMVGSYYTTTFVSNDQFGYQGIGGPQIFPTVRYAAKSGKVVALYFKYSPITDGLSVLQLSNRELATGLSVSFPLSSGRPISVSLDWSNLFINFGAAAAQSTSYNLGLSLGF